MDFKELINSSDYNFLRENEHLGKNIVFLTLGGSHAYGTNVEGSDVDIRGCALPRKKELIGLSNFEQVQDSATDTTIYCFSKLISLMSNCNPNTIEMLGCKPEHYIYMTQVGEDLISNRKMFLSQRARQSFGGYAQAQLRRLQNAVARDSLTQTDKEIHILNSIKSSMNSFNERYTDFESGSLKVYVGESGKAELDSEVFIDSNLSGYPLRDFKGMFSEMSEIVKLYGKLNHRNNKKDDLHLNKHAMHLIRLYLMVIDIFEKEEIITYRKDDLDLLMSIRNGKFMNDDGTYHSSFFDMVDEFDNKLTYAMDNTSLPAKPDFNRIEEFVMSVHEKVILGEN